MKKIVSSIFAFLLFSMLTVLPGKVLAQDYWVYSDGKIDYYVMTETIDKKYDSYDLKVKYVHKKYAPEYRTLSVEYRAMMKGRRHWKYKVWYADGSSYESIEQNHWSGAVWKYLIDNYESNVSDKDVWVYSNEGRNYYVMTETIDYGQHGGMGGDGFSVYTKMTENNNGEVLKIHWIFKIDGRYKNNHNESDSTLARHVFDYCINYINTHR